MNIQEMNPKELSQRINEVKKMLKAYASELGELEQEALRRFQDKEEK